MQRTLGGSLAWLARFGRPVLRLPLFALVAFAVFLLMATGTGEAGQERFEYDPVGRLVRFVDSQNVVTEYVYDAAGNILSVQRSVAALSPVLSSIAPSVVRRGQTASLVITGERMQLGTLRTPDPGLVLGNVAQTATQITAALAVGPSVALGTQTLTFSNATGSASIGLLVAPALPVLSVEPSPLALPPDNAPRQITVRLSQPDLIAHPITITSSDPTKATVSPASVAIEAGQNSVAVGVTPKASGFLSLVLSSPALSTVTVPVFVTSDFRGVNTSHAPSVGVKVGETASPAVSALATISGARVGLAVGPIINNVAPRAFAVGGTYGLVLTGQNLPGGLSVSVSPAAGVATTITSADSQRIEVALTVDATAAAGLRQLVVVDTAGKPVPLADATATQFRLTTGQPEIDSIEPMFAAKGAAFTLKVRGRNLQMGKLLIDPSTDLRVDADPAVNASGTELLAGVHVAPLAASGARRVQVVTPSGQSTAEATAANQFTVASEIGELVSPVASPLVGVLVGNGSTGLGTTTIGPLQAPHVGMVVGAAAISAAPSVAPIGVTTTLTITGIGLQAVQSVGIVPAEQLAIGPLNVNAEGTALAVPVGVGATAIRGSRRLELQTAGGKLIFVQLGGDQVLMAAPAPSLISVAPQVVVTGVTTTLTVRGRNFTDIGAIEFSPPEGLTAQGPFTTTEGNTVLSVGVVASASAPTGTRTLIIHAAGGSSTNLPMASNTFQVAQQVGPTYTAIASSIVGLAVGSLPTQLSETVGVHAPVVGVTVESTATPPRVVESFAQNVGVVVGAAVNRITPRAPAGFLKGSQGSLTVEGVGLDQVTQIVPVGAGVTFGAATVAGDGTTLLVPVTTAADAVSGTYGIQLSAGTGTATTRVTALAPVLFNVGALPTNMASVAPIVLEQGKSYGLVIRGANLRDVYEVFAASSSGLVFGPNMSAPQWTTDALGEKLTVTLVVHSEATIGSRVIQLRVPGGTTDSQATPANTITIVAPQ